MTDLQQVAAETSTILEALIAGQSIGFNWNLGNYFLSNEPHRWVSADTIVELSNAGLLKHDGYGYALDSEAAADLAYDQAAAAWLRAQASTYPLAQPVRVRSNGVVGVVTGVSTCDASRRRVSYFSRRLWACRYLWTSIENLEPMTGAAESAADESATLSA